VGSKETLPGTGRLEVAWFVGIVDNIADRFVGKGDREF
jgi:hypothetical protein